MTKEWSEEGLNFEARMPIKEVSDYGIQKVIEQSSSLTDENQEGDCDD